MTTTEDDGHTVYLLRATRAEARGANLVVGGLSVVRRTILQLSRLQPSRLQTAWPRVGPPPARGGGARPIARVVLATDGSVPVPPDLPIGVEVRQLDALDPQAFDSVLANWPDAVVLGADTFWRTAELPRPNATGPRGAHAGLRIVDETTRRQAEDILFADLLRGDLGFIARHLNKRISFWLTRHVLCRLPVTPNQVTVGAAAVGFAGCLLVATGRYLPMVAGLVLAQLQSILDGCDGELARVRFQQSAIGEWLDTLMDDGLNLALVAALGVGMYRAGWGAAAPAASAVTGAMLLTYNAVSYRELVRQRLGGELLKIRWKLNRGRNMKALWASPDGLGAGKRFILTLGRRDTFVFAWMILGILNLFPVILMWAFAIALPSFVAAIGQMVLPAESPSEGDPAIVRDGADPVKEAP